MFESGEPVITRINAFFQIGKRGIEIVERDIDIRQQIKLDGSIEQFKSCDYPSALFNDACAPPRLQRTSGQLIVRMNPDPRESKLRHITLHLLTDDPIHLVMRANENKQLEAEVYRAGPDVFLFVEESRRSLLQFEILRVSQNSGRDGFPNAKTSSESAWGEAKLGAERAVEVGDVTET